MGYFLQSGKKQSSFPHLKDSCPGVVPMPELPVQSKQLVPFWVHPVGPADAMVVVVA